jgi:hypothetical protein
VRIPYNLMTTQAQPIDLSELQPQESERAHLFSMAAGVLLPMLQAVITGCLAGMAATFYAWVMKSPEAWKWGAGVGLGVMVISWLLLVLRWLNLTAPLERLTGRDLNHDGYVGQPPKTIRVEFKAEKNQLIIANLPDNPQARQFYGALIRGEKNGIHNWTGRNKPLTPSEYEEIRDSLINRTFARWIGEPSARDGWELTPYGRHALRAIVAPSPAPDETDL